MVARPHDGIMNQAPCRFKQEHAFLRVDILSVTKSQRSRRARPPVSRVIRVRDRMCQIMECESQVAHATCLRARCGPAWSKGCPPTCRQKQAGRAALPQWRTAPCNW
eukprot:5577322-Pyramimonas_sp.AAC.1